MSAATERFSMVPSSLLEHSGLKGREKVVLVALLSFCDRAGVCFPSLSRLAKTAGLSTATVKRSLCLLESQGLLSRKRRMSPEGDFTSTLYTLGGLSQIETTLSQADTTLSHAETRVVSNCDNGLSQIETLTYSFEQTHGTDESGKNPNAFPSKESPSKPSLEAEALSQDNPNAEMGEPCDMEPEAVFEEKVRADFKDLVELFPKKEGASKKAFELYKAFFSRERRYFKRNDFRATNIFSAVEGYRRSCEGQEQRFIKSLSRFLEEIDPDQEVTEIVTVYGQRKAS